MNDYAHHYAILGVTPDTEWTALRLRYRRLIGQWHPDRFLDDAPARKVAEEQSKHITIAYQALERYYRDHGVLPLPVSASVVDETGTGAPPVQTAPRSPSRAPRAAMPEAGATAGELPGQAAAQRRRLALIVLSALIAGAFGAYLYPGDEARGPGAVPDEAHAGEGAATEPQALHQPPESGGISPGSTLGEVYAIQGIPTQTQGDTWHYGKSSIRFAQGKVVAWTQHPDNPLRIARDQPIDLHEGVFDAGLTKAK